MTPENKNELSWANQSFLAVCREHKEKCKGDCNVSMFALGRIFRGLTGRELTDEELKIFI